MLHRFADFLGEMLVPQEIAMGAEASTIFQRFINDVIDASVIRGFN